MALRMVAACFWGASFSSELAFGSSTLIDRRSAKRPARSIRFGSASGMVFRWM